MRIRSRALINVSWLIAILMMAPMSAFAQKSKEDEARRYYLRGVAAVEMAKSDEELANAVEEFRKAAQMAPTMASAWYNLGMVQSKIGRIKDAIDSFGRFVALSPASEEVKKVSDEMIKLEYKLEQAEKFKHLSGIWIVDGKPVQVTVAGLRIIIRINEMIFPGIVETWMWSDRAAGDGNVILGNIVLQLEVRGNRLAGIIEIVTPPSSSSGSSRHQWCSLPPGKETNQVEGMLTDGTMQLKIKKTKYRFEHNKGENMLFGSNNVRCDAVTSMGDIVFDKTLRGPFPIPSKGGVGVQLNGGRYVANVYNSDSGLLPGDEIVSVDGVELANLASEYERILRLRGEPGSVANLVVKRVLEKAGAFTEEKSTMLNFSIQRVEVKAP